MANTLRFKRGLASGIPTAVAGEPLFTTDTFDLYIGNGTTNTRFQKYIASGSTSQLLRGDGSLLTMPIVLTSPSNGQVLKYNGTNWVNDSDAGVTGSGTTNYLPKWTSSSALGNSLAQDTGSSINIGTATTYPATKLVVGGSSANGGIVSEDTAGAGSFVRILGDASNGNLINYKNGTSLRFASSAADFTTFAEQMRLTSTGLGIGTTSPGYKLDVNGSFRASSPVVTGDPNGYASFQPLYFAGAPNTPTTYFQVISNGNGSDFSQLGIGYNNRMYYRWGTNAWTELQSAISNPITGTRTTNYLPKFTGTSTIGNSNLINDASGNLGLGVVPSAWTDFKVFQNVGGSLIGEVGQLDLWQNAYYDGTSKYYANGNATRYSMLNGTHRWFYAAIGTANGAISFTQAMTLTAGGNLLLGTTTDVGQKLYVNGDVKVGTYLFMASEGSGSVLGDISTGNYLRFLVSNGERMRITSGGNVLINTTTDAGYKLDVNGTARVANSLVSNNYIGTTLGSGGVYFSGDPSPDFGFIGYNYTNVNATESVYQSIRESWRIRFGNGATKTMSFGMRVGSAAASAWSEYFSLASGGAATFSSSVTAGNIFSRTANYPQIVFEETTSSTNSLIFYDNVSSTKQLGFRVNSASNVMTLTSTSVGIGNTSPAAKLHLVDSVESEIRTQYSTTSSGKLITGNGFTTIGSITNDPLVFVSNNTERMRLTNGGNLLLGSTSDTGEKFQVTGAGIVSGLFTVSGSTGIPATTASNLRFASGFASPDIGRMYIGDGTGWKFHMSKRLSSTTTDLITFFDNGSVQTSAPTGYAAKPYKLGEVLTNAATADRSIVVEIDGTVYFLLASTTAP
jgi:hypothetical protein